MTITWALNSCSSLWVNTCTHKLLFRRPENKYCADLHVENAEEAKSPALAQREAALHVDAHAAVVEGEPLQCGLQLLGLALVKRINSSKHHRLKRENFKKRELHPLELKTIFPS